MQCREVVLVLDIRTVDLITKTILQCDMPVHSELILSVKRVGPGRAVQTWVARPLLEHKWIAKQEVGERVGRKYRIGVEGECPVGAIDVEKIDAVATDLAAELQDMFMVGPCEIVGDGVDTVCAIGEWWLQIACSEVAGDCDVGETGSRGIG